jgi:hypothetical protein
MIAGGTSLTSGSYLTLATITVPTPGVWLFTGMCSIQSTGGEGTVENKYVLLSTGNGTGVVAGTASFYMEQNDDVSDNSDPRDIINISTILTTTTALTPYYFQTLYSVDGLTMKTSAANLGGWYLTRIG